MPDHSGRGEPTSPDPESASSLNIAPFGDGALAACVANAPGGPVHVLLSDELAEHIPGCNMAFRREQLFAVGGFDPPFYVAGDDVDIVIRPIEEMPSKIVFSVWQICHIR